MERACRAAEFNRFDSRVAETTKPWSDLDLAVTGPDSLRFHKVGRLIETLEESTLPFRVDVLDWHDVSHTFQAIIAKQYAVIQPGNPAGASQ